MDDILYEYTRATGWHALGHMTGNEAAAVTFIRQHLADDSPDGRIYRYNGKDTGYWIMPDGAYFPRYRAGAVGFATAGEAIAYQEKLGRR